MDIKFNQTPRTLSPNVKKWAQALNVFVALVIFDYGSKLLAVSGLTSPYPVFPGFNLQLEKNTGIAFSIAIPQFLLIPLNLFIFLALIVFLLRKTDNNSKLALYIIVLLAAGATGNLIDRFSYGYVVDFISFWNFPVFNLADAYISVSVFLLILFYDRIKRPN